MVRVVDMGASNAWAEQAAIFARTKAAHAEHESAKSELKALIPEDAKEAFGHGLRAKRSKSGRSASNSSRTGTAMRSSSDSIAQLASALAKAQIELVNPAKTLTAVIYPGDGNEERSYRYAPLSAGLEIVRKTLGQHELAVIQTTHVERESAMVLLITTLAHGSGEWIAASWPVCRIADMTNPKLMGAALTYARRYGLFTLVGLAGEDDLDAPSELIERERDCSALRRSRCEGRRFRRAVYARRPRPATPARPSQASQLRSHSPEIPTDKPSGPDRGKPRRKQRHASHPASPRGSRRIRCATSPPLKIRTRYFGGL